MSAAFLIGLVLAQVAGGPLTLDQALTDARAGNLDLKVAQARLDEARTLSGKVWASYLPQITAGGSYTYNNFEAKLALPTGYAVRDICPPGAPLDACKKGPAYDPSRPAGVDNPPGSPTQYITVPSGLAEAIIQKQHQVAGQVQVSQVLLAPALWPAIQESYLAAEYAELGVDTVRREILFAVAQLYYGAVGAKEATKVQALVLEANLAHEKDAKVRVDAGAAPRVVLLRAQIDRTKSERDVLRAKNAYDSTRSALATLLAREPDFEVVMPEEPPLPGDLSKLEEMSSSRPDVQASLKGLALAEKGKTGAVLAYLPNLGVSGTYRVANFAGLTGKSDSWFVTLGLGWTLWDGGLREANLRDRDAKIAEADAMRRGTEIKARDEVRRARLDYESAQANKLKAEETVRLARENRQLVDVGFKAGTSTYLEVADATTALVGAELGSLAETLNAQLAVLKLAKAAGAFNPQ